MDIYRFLCRAGVRHGRLGPTLRVLVERGHLYDIMLKLKK
jgi:hypothetical protein